MPDDAVAVVRRWIEAINSADVELYRSVVASDLVHHSGAGDLTVDEVVEGFWFYKRAFPDLTYELHEVVAIGAGSAVARWTMRGTHTGTDFFGAVATGRGFATPGLSLHDVREGHIVEEWEYSADLGMFRQLGFRLDPPAGGA